MGTIDLTEVALRLFLAVAIAAALGWERDRHGKPAGLRTHMLVSLGSAAFMLATIEPCQSDLAGIGNVRLDPVRTVAGVVGGIGFLGAGSIFQSRGSVEGITTAAGIWIMGAIGVACGAGYYVIAGLTAAMALFVVGFVGWLALKFGHGARHAG